MFTFENSACCPRSMFLVFRMALRKKTAIKELEIGVLAEKQRVYFEVRNTFFIQLILVFFSEV